MFGFKPLTYYTLSNALDTIEQVSSEMSTFTAAYMLVHVYVHIFFELVLSQVP